MKRSTLILTLIALALSLYAQRDSLIFAHGPWQTDTLDGLVLRQCRFEGQQLFASNQQIFLLEIPDTAHYTLRFAHEPRRTKSSEMAQKHGAVAAVNGSFFYMDQHFPVCFL
ncbi:MAG: hypothetical protein J6Z44_07310, partial [Bacteroidales bacterium]|nr:hypothetical protein [Bacteroidales bacterium]